MKDSFFAQISERERVLTKNLTFFVSQKISIEVLEIVMAKKGGTIFFNWQDSLQK